MWDRNQHLTRIKIPALDTLSSKYREELYLVRQLHSGRPMHAHETCEQFEIVRAEVLETESRLVWEDLEGLLAAIDDAAALANRAAEYHANTNPEHSGVLDYIRALREWRAELLERKEEVTPVYWPAMQDVVCIH